MRARGMRVARERQPADDRAVASLRDEHRGVRILAHRLQVPPLVADAVRLTGESLQDLLVLLYQLREPLAESIVQSARLDVLGNCIANRFRHWNPIDLSDLLELSRLIGWQPHR